MYYVNVQGLIKRTNQIVCKSLDETFIETLNNYIETKNAEAFESVLTIIILEKTHQQKPIKNQIGNSIFRRPKGRQSGIKRHKRLLESINTSESNVRKKVDLCYTGPMTID